METDFGRCLATSGDGYIEFYGQKTKEKIDNFRNKNTLIDLHIHSSYSDGDLTPNELIQLAVSKNIGTISITDHDTLLGNQNIDCPLDNIRYIPGIELSAKTDKRRMHILGYGIDIYDINLNKKMSELQNNSINSLVIFEIPSNIPSFFAGVI